MPKISPEDKIYYCEQYLFHNMTQTQIAKLAGVARSSLRHWLMKYESMGTDAFYKNKNNKYSPEMKLDAVTDYLAGSASLQDICKKYKLHSTKQLKDWIMQYNNLGELKIRNQGGHTTMAKGRKTTLKERIEIVEYCIANNNNYANTAIKYNISYQQARNYTIKYQEGGVDALSDNRGKAKSKDQMTEVDRLRAELKLTKAKLERKEMELNFLKKLDEIEKRLD